MAAQPADAQDGWNSLMWELTKSFRFEAAHTLSGTTLGAAGDEVHGHSFRAEVAIEGSPDPRTGMVVDLGRLERSIVDVRRMLDHKLLNRIEALGPPTLENLARFICEQIRHVGPVTRVTVYRDSCSEACTYRPGLGSPSAL
jgi:6-pyruvoyltetrahydropterin/6-carboxytetrahydropterin synthase